jgi:hypothetical protein
LGHIYRHDIENLALDLFDRCRRLALVRVDLLVLPAVDDGLRRLRGPAPEVAADGLLGLVDVPDQLGERRNRLGLGDLLQMIALDLDRIDLLAHKLLPSRARKDRTSRRLSTAR